MMAIFPEIAAAVAANDIEQIAVLVRKYFGGDQTYRPQPDIELIFKDIGLPIFTKDIDSKAALIAKDEKGRFDVVSIHAQEKRGYCERRFLLAHQLGHYFLHMQPLIARGDWRSSGFRETQCPMRRYEIMIENVQDPEQDERREAEADQFAAALLLPKGMVKRAESKILDREKLADFFGVTKGVIQRRLEEIGSVESSPSSFFAAERQISGKRSEEPLVPTQSKIGHEELAKEISYPQGQDATPTLTKPQAAKAYNKLEEPQPPAEENPIKGMGRIREIAKMLENKMR